MRFLSWPIYCLFLVCTLGVFGQELPPIQNIAPTTYQGGNQSWAIDQAESKLIYIANNDGLIEFDGARWTLYPSPNESILRSVNVIGDRIYTGAFMDFGYWEKDQFGELTYRSIAENSDIDLIEDEEFWKIIEVDEWIIFQSLRRVYIYQPKEEVFQIIDSEQLITRVFQLTNGRILFQRTNEGIFEIINGKDSLFLDEDALKNDEVIQVFEKDERLLFLTKNNGFYQYQ